MKKILMILLFLSVASNLVAQDNQGYKYQSTKAKEDIRSVLWYKRIVDGSTSYFASNIDTVLVTGASDTLHSIVYNNMGKTSVSLYVSGGTTRSIQFIAMTANSGDSAVVSLNDNHFGEAYWLKIGTGLTGNTASTSEDSITTETTGYTTPIQLDLKDAQLFKFIIISNVSQNGNTTIRSDLCRQER